MVVGVKTLLQEGKTYSYGDLQRALGLDEGQFSLVFDALVSTHCIRLALVEHGSFVLSSLERDLLWRAERGKAQEPRRERKTA